MWTHPCGHPSLLPPEVGNLTCDADLRCLCGEVERGVLSGFYRSRPCGRHSQREGPGRLRDQGPEGGTAAAAVLARRPARSSAHHPALSSTSPALASAYAAGSRATLGGSSRQLQKGCGGARALRVLPGLSSARKINTRGGSGARRDRGLRAALLWPDLLARHCNGPLGFSLSRISSVERRAPAPFRCLCRQLDCGHVQVQGGAPPKLLLIVNLLTLAHTSSLNTDLKRNIRAPHFTPKHWLLCHMGLY